MSSISESERNRLYNIQEYGIDTKHFTIYMQGVESDPSDNFEEPGIEYRIANRLIKNLDILTGINAETPITISMKTAGGFWEEGMAIYDAILSAPNPVSIINYTHARSMSSIIFQAANKRIMMPHSYFMFHMGTLEFEGIPKQAYSYMDFNKIANEQMMQIYIDCLKQSQGKAKNWSRKKIREWLTDKMNEKEDVYMTAEETVQIGFADEIFKDWDSVTQYTNEQLDRK